MDGGPAVMIRSLRGRLFLWLTAIIILTGAVKRTVERLGGTIALENVAGSDSTELRVTVHLPAATRNAGL